MKITTVGIFENKQDAEQAINELKDSGISEDDISCVYADVEGDIKDIQNGDSVSNGDIVVVSHSDTTDSIDVFENNDAKEIHKYVKS